MDGRDGEAALEWVDAFSGSTFGGNPAAVCLLAEEPDAGWMQALAGELGISETAFVWPGRAGRYRLRWFAPKAEVDLCGHATLAAAHVLGRAGLLAEGATVEFDTRGGLLRARRDGTWIELDLPADPPGPPPGPVDWAGVLPGGPEVRDVVAGRRDLVAVVGSAEEVRDVAPDLEAVAALAFRSLCVTAPATGGDGRADYVLRLFGPRVGIDEDPVTGSVQCVLGPYWSGRLGRSRLEAVQLSRRGGRLRVAVDGERVRVGGEAVTVLSGRVPVPGRQCARDAGVDPDAGRTTGTLGSDPCTPEGLARLVADQPPVDDREARSKERFLAELARLPRPCDEDAGPVHVTASAVVVGDRGTVLHRHRRLGRWMQPGGHIDPGEDPAAAALRESEEETGLTLSHPAGGPVLIHLDVHEAANGHTHLDLRYLLVGPDADPDPPPGESPDARWYGWEEARRMADESLAGALDVARQMAGDMTAGDMSAGDMTAGDMTAGGAEGGHG